MLVLGYRERDKMKNKIKDISNVFLRNSAVLFPAVKDRMGVSNISTCAKYSYNLKLAELWEEHGLITRKKVGSRKEILLTAKGKLVQEKLKEIISCFKKGKNE